MTSRWRKHLLKLSDLFVTMPFDDVVCPESNFKPLVFAIVLPFINNPPWKIKDSELLRRCQRKLQTVWKDDLPLGGGSSAETFQGHKVIGNHVLEYGAGNFM